MKFGSPRQIDIDYYHRKPRPEKCKAGHYFTLKNSKYQFDSRDGSVRRRCRICESRKQKQYSKTYKDKLKKKEPHWSEYSLGGV